MFFDLKLQFSLFLVEDIQKIKAMDIKELMRGRSSQSWKRL